MFPSDLTFSQAVISQRLAARHRDTTTTRVYRRVAERPAARHTKGR